MAITCSPTENIAIVKCVQCWTPKQKLSALVALLCAINAKTTDECTANDIAETAECYTCASDTQLLDSIIGIAYQYAVDVTGLEAAVVTAWIEDTKACFGCLQDKQLRAAIVALLCQFYNTAAR